ncbi:MAG: recombination protein O N-terminal domain-containing protein [Candidatus Taylorbacteria bacterium]|nr:recombination protein O N-terminal domain-containing protein [Candidatus Taylorbacteria bacterium]
MYRIYETKGIVLETRPRGEAGASVTILTDKFGLVRAAAPGLRLSRSKLRFGLTTYSLSRLALVRGRDGWRVTDAAAAANLFFGLRSRPDDMRLLERLFTLLKRLTPEEGGESNLYRVICGAARFVLRHHLSPEKGRILEALTALRILSELGYGPEAEEFSTFFSRPSLGDRVLASFKPHLRRAYREINTALRASQL